MDLSGQLFAAFYIATALATITYYRRRILSSVREAIMLGVLPLAAAGFLIWILVKYFQTAAMPQLWSIAGVTAAGFLVMAYARLRLRSEFFRVPREAAHEAVHKQ